MAIMLQKNNTNRKNTSKDDLVIFLISGGASALLCSPLDGINFDEKQKLIMNF